jgi:hypothetical protein
MKHGQLESVARTLLVAADWYLTRDEKFTSLKSKSHSTSEARAENKNKNLDLDPRGETSARIEN